MSVHPEHRLLSALGPVWLAAVASVGFPAPARAIVPDVVFVEAASVNNSASPKVAVAQCPLGRAVLGGTAAVRGEEGQVAIQAAFPVAEAEYSHWTAASRPEGISPSTGQEMSPRTGWPIRTGPSGREPGRSTQRCSGSAGAGRRWSGRGSSGPSVASACCFRACRSGRRRRSGRRHGRFGSMPGMRKPGWPR